MIRNMLIAFMFSLCTVGMAGLQGVKANEILVAGDDFNVYMREAQPGDVFTIFPGVYRLKNMVKLLANGTADQPIIIRPSLEGAVTLEIDMGIGFQITGQHWTLENLKFVGVCELHERCEHAIQIVGNADYTTLRGNTFNDFNSTIKANGLEIDGVRRFPDHVLIESNYIFNPTPRQTGSPVTLIDVVGGRHWVIRDNFIADFQKAHGNHISYAAFLKGNSENGLFERNLIICEWRHKGGTRLGLSLGGGGTEKQFCQGGTCVIEHYMGIIRSNIILNCPDVGIYLNRAANTKIINNTILNTPGVDVRFSTSFAMLANNVIEGRILDRDGGSHREENNLVERSLAEMYPQRDFYDLSPSEPKELMDAAREYEGLDFCSGEMQERWVGAIALPAKCSIREKMQEAVTRQIQK